MKMDLKVRAINTIGSLNILDRRITSASVRSWEKVRGAAK